MMDISLEGKNAVVCGSTQGIGLAIAKELAALGATCLLLARNKEALAEVVSGLDAGPGQRHRYYVADFSRPEELKKAIGEIVASAPVHILVNNTGGPPAGPALEATEKAFEDAFQQHLLANHILVRAVVPSMKQAQYGRIINIISTSVRIPIPNLGVSNTIRGAVASWAKTLSNELGPFQITVNNILPGFTHTQRLEQLMELNAQKRGVAEAVIREEMIAQIPVKRFADASEIAAVAAFLASPAASYVTGVSIPVDGGKTGVI